MSAHSLTYCSFFPLFSSYIYHMVDTAWALTYTTISVLRDFAADGVVYLELRTTPRAMPKAGLSKSQYVETILNAISGFESGHTTLRTRLILSIDRRNTLEEALEVVALAREFRGRGVVGIDLCGDPKKGGIEALTPAFELAKRELPELGLTLHFAEAEYSGTDEELNMLLDWLPDRIGHVIHVGDKVKDRIIKIGRLGLELCLSCNVHANMITGGFEAHHFGEWWKVKECVVALSVSWTSNMSRAAFCSPVSRLTWSRPMMSACSAARFPMNMLLLPNTSGWADQKFATWQGLQYKLSLDPKRIKNGYDTSCGRNNRDCQHRLAETIRGHASSFQDIKSWLQVSPLISS